LTVWRLITGEYPPQNGGVSDYSRLVAKGLAASGDTVHIYAPPIQVTEDQERGVEIHRLPGHFDPRSLRVLGRELSNPAGDRTDDVVLVQYVPHAFGFKAMNLPFCLWLYAFSRRHRRILVMIHEATVPFRRGQPLSHQMLASVTALMAMLVARAASVIFVSIPAWKDRLKRSATGKRIEWLPVPSNVPIVEDRDAAEAMRPSLDARTLVGHFGTFDEAISQSLRVTLPRLLEATPDAGVLLIGRDTVALRESIVHAWPKLTKRVQATGGLPAKAISAALAACDLMVQPYPDGVSTRRGSAMAALAHRRAIVTTAGVLTEPLWAETGAVALAPAGDHEGMYRQLQRLAADAGERDRIALAGKRLYEDRFALCHTLNALQAAARE
jgi:glycosyltransferase involved in cell wall biosynthesis